LITGENNNKDPFYKEGSELNSNPKQNFRLKI